MRKSAIFKSSVGRKFIMGLTGLFLISFLVIHAAINACVWFNDGGKTFTYYAHFMGTNFIVHILEVGLFAGFIAHIIYGFILQKEDRAARPVKYYYSNPNANSKWYSRSMGLLGTLILLFLIIHLRNFWGPNRLHQITAGKELDLFQLMLDHFSHWWVVLIYVAGCVSLMWHLMHGFRSAFQSLGINHLKYNHALDIAGKTFSIGISVIFALMPISMYFGWVK